MKVGTKSVLFGAHCFLLHPFFVAIAWIKLYGFPFDLRIWIAFFVHDLGYWGKPNMDGPEGETHVELGAKIMHIFDGYEYMSIDHPVHSNYPEIIKEETENGWQNYDSFVFKGRKVFLFKKRSKKWLEFTMYHSRYYAKKNNVNPSQLCFADKLSFCVTPRWLYLPMVNATGEINEYLKNEKKQETPHWKPVEGQKLWHSQLSEYMSKWVEEHKDGSPDTWTEANRHQITDRGIAS